MWVQADGRVQLADTALTAGSAEEGAAPAGTDEERAVWLLRQTAALALTGRPWSPQGPAVRGEPVRDLARTLARAAVQEEAAAVRYRTVTGVPDCCGALLARIAEDKELHARFHRSLLDDALVIAPSRTVAAICAELLAPELSDGYGLAVHLDRQHPRQGSVGERAEKRQAIDAASHRDDLGDQHDRHAPRRGRRDNAGRAVGTAHQYWYQHGGRLCGDTGSRYQSPV